MIQNVGMRHNSGIQFGRIADIKGADNELDEITTIYRRDHIDNFTYFKKKSDTIVLTTEGDKSLLEDFYKKVNIKCEKTPWPWRDTNIHDFFVKNADPQLQNPKIVLNASEVLEAIKKNTFDFAKIAIKK